MSQTKFEILFRPLIYPMLTKDKIWIGLSELLGRRYLHKEKSGIKRQSLTSNELGKASKLKDEGSKFQEEDFKKIKDAKDEVKDGGLKRVFMKEWSEQSPAWFTRNEDENNLLKQLEVLQRFSTRSKNESTENTGEHSLAGDPKETSKKKLMKMIDKSSSKNYGTFVTALAMRKKFLATAPPIKPERRSLNPIESRTAITQEARQFLTLANETPYVTKRTLSTSFKKKPTLRNITIVNPDALQTESVYGKRVKPKLYSIINPPSNHEKEFDAYIKKITPPTNKKKEKPLTIEPSITIGEYFTGRYTPEKLNPTKRKASENLTKGLKDTLVEERRAVTTKNEKGTNMVPLIHPKTSLQVKTSDLPIQLCKNMKASNSQDSSKQEHPNVPKKSPIITRAEAENLNSVTDSLLNRIIKYFKR